MVHSYRGSLGLYRACFSSTLIMLSQMVASSERAPLLELRGNIWKSGFYSNQLVTNRRLIAVRDVKLPKNRKNRRKHLRPLSGLLSKSWCCVCPLVDITFKAKLVNFLFGCGLAVHFAWNIICDSILEEIK